MNLQYKVAFSILGVLWLLLLVALLKTRGETKHALGVCDVAFSDELKNYICLQKVDQTGRQIDLTEEDQQIIRRALEQNDRLICHFNKKDLLLITSDPNTSGAYCSQFGAE